MPDSLEVIVQRMMNAGESDDAIEAVVKAYPGYKPAKVAKKDTYDGPTTFMGGFLNSLKPGGEAFNAGMKGGFGFLKGATIDIPHTLKEGVYGVGAGLASILDDPIKHAKAAPQAFKEMGQGIADTFKNAGNESEAFGRMVGQMTGQPIVTEGLIAGVPRIPAAARFVQGQTGKALEGVGRVMRDDSPAPGVPPTPRMLGTRTARKIVGAAGEKAVDIGGRMRRGALGVEDAGNLAKRAPQSPPSGNILTEPPPSQADPNIGPMLEDPLDLASRNPEPQPSAFSGDYTAEADPMFQTPAEPPPGANLSTNKAPSLEEQFAQLIEQIRTETAKDPSVEAPPAPYSQGASAPPEQPRYSVKASAKPRKKGESPYEGMSLDELIQLRDDIVSGKKPKPTPKTEAPNPPAAESNFEPSVDPKKLLEGVDPEKLKAALDKMAAKDAGVDLTTGEIIEPHTPKPSGKPKRAGSRFRNPFNNETGAVGFDIGPLIAAQQGTKGGDILEGAKPKFRSANPVNPLRPVVPEGQVTNRQMFDLSAQRGAEESLAAKAADTPEYGQLSHEFDQDMLFTPEELVQPEVPVMESPVDNPYDPRIAPGGVVSDTDPVSPPVKQRTSLFGDQRGAVGKDISNYPVKPGDSDFLDRMDENALQDFITRQGANPNYTGSEQGQKLLDWADHLLTERKANPPVPINKELPRKPEATNLSPKEIADYEAIYRFNRLYEEGKIPNDPTNPMMIEWAKTINRLGTLGSDGKLVPRNPPNGSFTIRPYRFEKFLSDERGMVGKDINAASNAKSVGDRRWSIAHPSGKPIADIEITRAEIAAARKAGKVPDGMSDVDYSNALFQEKLDKLGSENGYGPNDLSRLRLTYHTKAAKEGQVDTNVRNPTAKSKPVGPKGKSWKVSGAKGEKLGDITVTPDEIEGIIKDPQYEHLSPDEVSQIIYEDKLEDLMIDNGIDPDRVGELNIEQMNIREKRVGSPNKKEIPAEKATEPKKVKEDSDSNFPTAEGDRPRVDPDAAFAQGGDINPIRREAALIEAAGGTDLAYKRLLPESFRFGLKEGETFKQRLANLLEAIGDETPAGEALQARRLKERDDFIKSVQGVVAPDEPVLRAKELRGLRSKDVKWSKRYGRFDTK